MKTFINLAILFIMVVSTASSQHMIFMKKAYDMIKERERRPADESRHSTQPKETLNRQNYIDSLFGAQVKQVYKALDSVSRSKKTQQHLVDGKTIYHLPKVDFRVNRNPAGGKEFNATFAATTILVSRDRLVFTTNFGEIEYSAGHFRRSTGYIEIGRIGKFVDDFSQNIRRSKPIITKR